MPKAYARKRRERAVRPVVEHLDEYETEHTVIRSIATKLGITTPETVRKRVRRGRPRTAAGPPG